MLQWTKKHNLKLYCDTALTKVKQQFLFKIQGLTFNKSGNLVCVLQTLFLDQDPNQLGNKSNRGSKIESAAIFSPEKYSNSEISGKDSWHVECHVFIKQLDLFLK